jgi:hypothetical protein
MNATPTTSVRPTVMPTPSHFSRPACGARRAGSEQTRPASEAPKRCTSMRIALLCALLAPLMHVCTDARGSDDRSPTTSPFTFVDVFIDPHGKPLAAYQLALRATSGDVKLVGPEGGEHKAFAHPPYYDPKALLNDRVVIAAFNTGAAGALPSGRTRVARLRVRVGDVRPVYAVRLHVAASADAKPIATATASTSTSTSDGAGR